jgi:hypothetical protein
MLNRAFCPNFPADWVCSRGDIAFSYLRAWHSREAVCLCFILGIWAGMFSFPRNL